MDIAKLLIAKNNGTKEIRDNRDKTPEDYVKDRNSDKWRELFDVT